MTADAGTRDRALDDVHHAQLRQAELLAVVARLSGGIAHDFNNLLTTILGYAELLDTSLQRHEQMAAERDDLKEIRRAAHRAHELTERLLAFAGRVPASTRIVDLERLLVGVERIVRRLANDAVRVSVVSNGEPVYCAADPAHLETVLLNLAVNAAEAMPGEGRLVMSASRWNSERDALPDGVVIGAAAAVRGDCVMLTVQDTGAGMDAARVLDAFHPYVSTKPSATSPARGLGLPTAIGLVTQAHGVVIVDSIVGSGTAVRVLLPRVEPDADDVENASADEPVSAPQMAPRAPGHSPSVLLIVRDDDERAAHTSALRNASHTVYVASDDATAASVLREQTMAVDIVVAEVTGDGQSALDVAHLARGTRPDVQLLMLASPDFTLPPGARLPERGHPVLMRPCTSAELVARVRYLSSTMPHLRRS